LWPWRRNPHEEVVAEFTLGSVAGGHVRVDPLRCGGLRCGGLRCGGLRDEGEGKRRRERLPLPMHLVIEPDTNVGVTVGKCVRAFSMPVFDER